MLAVAAFAAILLWVLVVRRHLPRRHQKPVPTELQQSIASFGGEATWLGLSDEDRSGLSEFVRLALTRRGRRQRAITVATRCAAGDEALAEWMLSNASLAKTRTQHTAYG